MDISGNIVEDTAQEGLPVNKPSGPMVIKSGTVHNRKSTMNIQELDPLEQGIKAEQLRKLRSQGYGKNLSAKQIDDLVNQMNTIFEMERLNRLMKEKQYPTNPVTGSLPTWLIGAFQPEFGDFLAATDLNFQKNIRKPITGAQASYSELQNLRPLAPSGKDVPEFYETKATRTAAGMKHAFNTALKALQANYNIKGFEPYTQEETLQPGTAGYKAPIGEPVNKNQTFIIEAPDKHREVVDDRETALKAVKQGWRLVK